MGLFDVFLGPKKQIEKENKLLDRPNHTVAEVIDCNTFMREEFVTVEDGKSEWQSVWVAEVTFRYCRDGQWQEERVGPEQGYTGYYVGQQLIVAYGSYGIHHFKRTLRKDSPNRI